MQEFPPVPLTLEGSSVLHQFFRFDWKSWRATPASERETIVAEFAAVMKKLERAGTDAPVQSAVFSELGHKGDLILLHFRDSLEALNQVELDFPLDKHVYVYCTCFRDATSAEVAHSLRKRGVMCSVIRGGLQAWKKAGLPLEAVPAEEVAVLPVFDS